MRDRFLALTLAVVVLLAGCSGAGGEAGGGDGALAVTEQAAATGTPAAEEATAADREAASGDTNAQLRNRKLIRTGQVALRVDSFDGARRNLTSYVRQQGGYIADSTQRVERVGNKSYTTGTIVLRVPAGNFSATFRRVKAEGEVISASRQTKDVTDQIVDLEARLKSLRAERERLRELYEQANDTEEILAVERELARTQTEIERTEARLRALENRVAFSTITVELREPRPEPDTDEPAAWYETSVVNAFLASVNGVVTLIRASVVGLAYLLPYALFFGVPFVGVVVVGHRLIRRS